MEETFETIIEEAKEEEIQVCEESYEEESYTDSDISLASSEDSDSHTYEVISCILFAIYHVIGYVVLLGSLAQDLLMYFDYTNDMIELASEKCQMSVLVEAVKSVSGEKQKKVAKIYNSLIDEIGLGGFRDSLLKTVSSDKILHETVQ